MDPLVTTTNGSLRATRVRALASSAVADALPVDGPSAAAKDVATTLAARHGGFASAAALVELEAACEAAAAANAHITDPSWPGSFTPPDDAPLRAALAFSHCSHAVVVVDQRAPSPEHAGYALVQLRVPGAASRVVPIALLPGQGDAAPRHACWAFLSRLLRLSGLPKVVLNLPWTLGLLHQCPAAAPLAVRSAYDIEWLAALLANQPTGTLCGEAYVPLKDRSLDGARQLTASLARAGVSLSAPHAFRSLGFDVLEAASEQACFHFLSAAAARVFGALALRQQVAYVVRCAAPSLAAAVRVCSHGLPLDCSVLDTLAGSLPAATATAAAGAGAGPDSDAEDTPPPQRATPAAAARKARSLADDAAGGEVLDFRYLAPRPLAPALPSTRLFAVPPEVTAGLLANGLGPAAFDLEAGTRKSAHLRLSVGRTGRWSSAAQTLPHQEVGGLSVRHAVVPAGTRTVLAALDYKQHEPRVLGSLVGVALAPQDDVYGLIAARAGVERTTAKAIVLARMYGQATDKAAELNNVDLSDANNISSAFAAFMRSSDRLSVACLMSALRRTLPFAFALGGFLRTLDDTPAPARSGSAKAHTEDKGRIPRRGFSTLIQGTAAAMTWLAVCQLDDLFEGGMTGAQLSALAAAAGVDLPLPAGSAAALFTLAGCLRSIVHDEIVLEAPTDPVACAAVLGLARHIMSVAAPQTLWELHGLTLTVHPVSHAVWREAAPSVPAVAPAGLAFPVDVTVGPSFGSLAPA